jgi:hypothetical protein
MAVKVARIAGLTTIYWGTRGGIGSSALTGLIVDSISVTPKNSGPIGEIENGDGAAVSLQVLDDGFDAKVKFTYDTSKTYPDIGDAVVIYLPKYGAAGGAQSYNCTMVAMPPDIARKKAAECEMTLVYRPGVDSSTITSVTTLS